MIPPPSPFLRVQLALQHGEQAVDVEEDAALLAGVARFGLEAVVGVAVRMDERLGHRPQAQHLENRVFLGYLHHDERRFLVPAVARVQNGIDEAARVRPLAASSIPF